MELLAAMVENLDRHIGRLIDHLRETGQYERTLVIFMSDNGANAADHFKDGNAFLRERYDNSFENMGSPTSWVSIGPEWAEASTAPFSRYKQHTRQGGMVSPLIMAGAGIERPGVISPAFVTVMDLAPTLLEVGGADYPEVGGIAPMLGRSMLDLLGGRSQQVHDDDYSVALMHRGRAFLRRGRWKLVTSDAPFAEERFELYDLESDPGETTNLRAEMPDVFDDMLQEWRATTAESGVVVSSGSRAPMDAERVR